MYSFEHKDTEHPMRDMRTVLEDTAHRAKDCLEHLLDEPCWDSQDLDDIVSQYLPMLKTMGIVNDNNQIDIEMAKGFINSAFEKSGRVTVMNFTFDKSDGEALIGILEKYRDTEEGVSNEGN